MTCANVSKRHAASTFSTDLSFALNIEGNIFLQTYTASYARKPSWQSLSSRAQISQKQRLQTPSNTDFPPLIISSTIVLAAQAVSKKLRTRFQNNRMTHRRAKLCNSRLWFSYWYLNLIEESSSFPAADNRLIHVPNTAFVRRFHQPYTFLFVTVRQSWGQRKEEHQIERGATGRGLRETKKKSGKKQARRPPEIKIEINSTVWRQDCGEWRHCEEPCQDRHSCRYVPWVTFQWTRPGDSVRWMQQTVGSCLVTRMRDITATNAIPQF